MSIDESGAQVSLLEVFGKLDDSCLYTLPNKLFSASAFSLGVDASVPLEYFRVGILVLVFNLDLTYDQNIFWTTLASTGQRYFKLFSEFPCDGS